MAQYLRVIRDNPNFRLLWFAQVVSLLGDWFNTIVLSVLVAEYSDGSGLAIGLFLMARFLPPMLFSPVAGVIVDRFNRQQVLIWCNVLRTGVVLMFLLATGPETLWLIYALTIIQFALSGLFEPGQSAITPSLVKRDDLVIANTLTSITWSSMLAVGAVIGGLVAAIFGKPVALVIDAATFAVAGYLISRIDVDPEIARARQEAIASDDEENGTFWDGVRFLRRNPSIAATTMVKGGNSIGNVDTLMTVYATQLFIVGDGGQVSLGIMYSAFGVGAFLGPLLMNRVNDGSIARMQWLIAVGFAGSMLGWFVLGGAGTLVVVSLALALRAMGGSVNWTYSTVIMQKTVPDRYLGRVFAMDLAIFQLITVISTMVHGVLVDLLNQGLASPLAGTYGTFVESDLLAQQAIADNLSMLSYATGVVSLLPLILWMIVLPRMRRQQAAIPAPAD